MADRTPTTDDVGIAIRDALELLVGIDSPRLPAPAEIGFMDAEDPSNLRIFVAGALFVVRVIREG
jgi:hypothetical protein